MKRKKHKYQCFYGRSSHHLISLDVWCSEWQSPVLFVWNMQILKQSYIIPFSKIFKQNILITKLQAAITGPSRLIAKILVEHIILVMKFICDMTLLDDYKGRLYMKFDLQAVKELQCYSLRSCVKNDSATWLLRFFFFSFFFSAQESNISTTFFSDFPLLTFSNNG